MNKYEQLIEHIINDDEAKARALFHDIVVEKSRDIYESLMDEEYTEESIGGNQVQGLVDEITMDETNGIGEGDDEMDHEFSLDSDDGDEVSGNLGGEFGGEEEDLESKVMKLEDELEALRAEFEEIISGEAGEEEHDDMLDMGDDEGIEDEEDEEDEESDEEDMFEAKDKEDKEDKEEDDEKEMTESRQANRRNMSAVDIMREYVEKISAPSNTEFTPVGTGDGGDKPAGNTKNPLAGKNDMGGTTQNIAKGGQGADANPDGTSPKMKADGKLVKNPQEIDVAKRNVNKPGGNKGAQDWYGTKAAAKKGEGQTTDGSVPVQKKSIEPGGN